MIAISLTDVDLRMLPAIAILVAAAHLVLLLLTRAWRPFGGHDAMMPNLRRPFGAPEAAVAIACALAAALTALTSGKTMGGPPPPPPRALAMALPALVYYTICAGSAMLCATQHGLPLRTAFFNAPSQRRATITGLGLGLAMTPPMLAISLASYHACLRLGLDTNPQEAFSLLQNPDTSLPARITLTIIAVVLAPVAEEFLFRGLLFPALAGKAARLWPPLLLQAAFFGAIHAHLPTFLPLSAAGVCFGLGYAATGSLLTPIAMHITFNAASLTLFMAGQ